MVFLFWEVECCQTVVYSKCYTIFWTGSGLRLLNWQLNLKFPQEQFTATQSSHQIVLLFSKETAYRVYDEFDTTQIEYQKIGDLMVRAEMPVDTWLTGYLLSFGAQVEIIEPKYLKGILAEQAQEIYKKNKP